MTPSLLHLVIKDLVLVEALVVEKCIDAIVMLLPAEITQIAPIHKGYKIDQTS